MNVIIEDIIDVVQAAVNSAPVPIIVDLITDVSDVYYKGCKWEDIEDKPELYNKSEVDTLLNGKQDKGDYVTNSTLTTNYYNKTEVDTKIDNVTVDLSDYYNKEQVDEKIDNIDIPTYTAGTDTDITDNVISSTFNFKNRNTHIVRKDYAEPFLMGGKNCIVNTVNGNQACLYLTGNDTTYTYVNNYGYKDLSYFPTFITNTQIHNKDNTISAKITSATCTDNVITITTDTTLGECNNTQFYFQLKVSGYNHLSLDDNSILNGYANVVGGYYNNVSGAGRNIVGGIGNLINTYDSIIAGAYNEVVGRSWESIIAGDHNYNYGDKSLVIGDYNENVGDNHIMLGYKNKNSRYSYWSMLTGTENESNSVASLIVGEKNKLNRGSQDSIVGGYGNEATGARSVLFGTNNKTTKANEFAVGTYNKSESDTLFSIGNGTSDSARSNIFEVKNTNKAYINGNEVATKEDVPNKYIVSFSTTDGANWAADKTFAETKAAYDKGDLLYAHLEQIVEGVEIAAVRVNSDLIVFSLLGSHGGVVLGEMYFYKDGRTSLSMKNLALKSEIPTKTSELTNDSGFATTTYVDNKIGDINTILEAL